MEVMKSKEKVLVADDKSSIVNLLVTALETEGYEVGVATTGREVMSQVAHSRPDLIVLDVLMPDLNGFETCEKLKANDETKEIPIIFMTGLSSLDDKIRGFQAGGNDYITKPVDVEEVLVRIKLHLSLHKRNKQLIAENNSLRKDSAERQFATDALNGANNNQKNRIEEKSDTPTKESKREQRHSKKETVDDVTGESDVRFRITVENLYEGIAFVENGIHRYVNKAYLKLFGYENPSELLAEPLSKILMKDTQKQIDKGSLSDAFFKSPASAQECQGIRKDGRVLDLEIFKTEIPSTQQDSSIVYVRDISKQKKLQGLLRHTQKMETIGILAGGIAHDFNNILGIIIGCSQLSLTLPEINKETDLFNHLTHILSAGFRAQDLVQQILFFNRQKEGEKKPLQISIIVKEALKMLRASIPSTIVIKQEIDREVGKVLADVIHIHQVLLSLCSNAAHAMRKNGGSLEVCLNIILLDEPDPELSCLSPGRYVLLTVSDTRELMDDVQLQRTFDPNFTIDEMEQGADFGLAVVRDIIQSYHGAFRVYRKPDQGLIHEVFIPQIAEDHKPETHQVDLKKIGKNNKVILLIDDDQTLMVVTEQILKSLGYIVESYNDSIEALNFFNLNPGRFDLVMTDMIMPELTGLELAEKILAVRPEIPVFLCTGFDDQVTEDQAKSYGVREFLLKPIELNILADKLANCLFPTSDITQRDVQD